MEEELRPPKILTLEGVKRSDFVPPEENMDERIREKLEFPSWENEVTSEWKGGALPVEFTTVEAWPDSTDLRCWNCCHTFDGPPCSVAIRVQDLEDPELPNKKNLISVKGVFCSWPCVGRYIHENAELAKNETTYLRNTRILRRLLTGNDSEIRMGPSREKLEVFGGEWSIEDYQKEILAIDSTTPNRLPGSILPERQRGGGEDCWDPEGELANTSVGALVGTLVNTLVNSQSGHEAFNDLSNDLSHEVLNESSNDLSFDISVYLPNDLSPDTSNNLSTDSSNGKSTRNMVKMDEYLLEILDDM